MTPFAPRQRALYTLVNTSTAPLWLAMVLAPRSPLTATLVRRVATPLLAALGLGYLSLLAASRDGERVDFRDPESVRRGLAQPTGFLAGWSHYLAFDLAIGRAIWEQGLAQGRSTRLALLLTWWAGPSGLTLWLGQQAVGRVREGRVSP